MISLDVLNMNRKSNISSFSKILRLTVFGNAWEDAYVKFFKEDLKFRFILLVVNETCTVTLKSYKRSWTVVRIQ